MNSHATLGHDSDATLEATKYHLLCPRNSKMFSSSLNVCTAWNYIYWSSRPLLPDNPLFKTVDEWYPPDTEDDEITTAHYERFLKCWDFLRPFFASRGFVLYEHGPQRRANYPPEQAIVASEDIYPYGRRLSKDREQLRFATPPCLRIWAARDKLGRDVVIKIVRESELEVLQYLNTEKARSDPRNHAIPLIDYGTVSGLSFAITPRWDSAFLYEFKTVAELMHMTNVLLEGLDFFHENRVFHADILEQNIGMNVALYKKYGVKQPPGLRDLSTTRYAYYDFENSSIYPIDTPLEDIRETKYAGFRLRGIKEPEGPYKPFPLDVLGLGLVLERRIRHIMNILPQLGPFLDGMVTLDETKRFTAHESLSEFEKIYCSLTADQLSQVLTTSMWSRKHGIQHINPDEI